MVQRRKEAFRGLLLYVGRGFTPPGRLDLGTKVPRSSRFWQGAKICRCGGLIEREGKPYGFLSHILSPLPHEKSRQKRAKVPAQAGFSPPQGAQPLFAPP